MGSRRFFYFLPACGHHLDFRRAIHAIIGEGFSFSASAFVNVHDDSGILLSANERSLEPPADRSLERMLNEGERLDVLCNDASLVLTCGFGSQHEDPVFSISMSRKSWLRLNDTVRAQYMQSLARIAGKSRAAYILVIDDPADDFLSHLEPIDDEWVVDLGLPDGSEYDASSVWVDSKVGILPNMRRLRSTGRGYGDFKEYEESLT